MNKIYRIFLLLLAIFLFGINVQADMDYPVDKNKNFYIYSFFKAASFDTETAKKFEWLKGYLKYFEYGVSAASGIKLPPDAIVKELDVEGYTYYKKYYYQNNFENNKTNAELSGLHNIDYVIQSKSELFAKIIETEVYNVQKVLANGNAEVSAFYLGVITKYFMSCALWPYGFSKGSPLGEIYSEAAAEFFDELDKLSVSDKIYKLNNQIVFDGFLGKFDGNETIKNMFKFTLLDSFNPEPVMRMNAIAMYNLLPMMDSLSKKVVISKAIDSLTGSGIDHTEWDDKYTAQIGKSANYSINNLYEILFPLNNLNPEPPVEIINLKYTPYNRQILLHWNLSTSTRKIQNQFIYRKNKENNEWELISTVPASAQIYFDKNNVMNGKKYLYKVTVKEPLHPETEGKKIEAIAIDNQPPAKPSRLTLESNNNAFTIILTKNSSDNEYDLNSYLLYVYDNKGNLIRNIKLPKDFRKFVVSNLKNDLPYRVGLTALDEAMNESEEEMGFVIPRDVEPPLAITNLKASGKNNVITISWTPSLSLAEDVDGQILTIYNQLGHSLKTIKLGPGVNKYTLDGLINDYPFKFGIKCFDEVPNYSKEIFISSTLDFEGQIFSVVKDNKDSENIVPYISKIDYNNDGYMDFIGNFSEKIAILTNNSGKSFTIQNTDITLNDTTGFLQIFTMDLNKDKIVDIICLDAGKLKIYRKNNRGKYDDFTKYTKINIIDNIAKISCGDFNNDQLIDIALLMKDGKLNVFRNLGNFSYENFNIGLGIISSDVFSFIYVFDVNNDGFSDILCQQNYIDNNKLCIYENIDGKKFNRKTIINNVSLEIKDAIAEDFNEDGFLEIFMVFRNTPVLDVIYNNFLFWNNSGRLMLNNDNPIDIINDAEAICSGDFNIDGRPDIFISTIDKKNYLFNNTAGAFTVDNEQKNILSISEKIRQAFLTDIDKDGDNDLILVTDNKLLPLINNINSFNAYKISGRQTSEAALIK